jgi:hypothetical protein
LLLLVERQHAVVEQIARRHRHLRRVDLGEAERAEHVDNDLHVDLADPLERAPVKRVRALLFQIEKDGPAGKRWGNCPDVIQSAIGFANYVLMIDPKEVPSLKSRALALRGRT